MIYHYLYQEKLFKNKSIKKFEYLHHSGLKKIIFKLNIIELFFRRLKQFLVESLKYFFEYFVAYDFFYYTFKQKNSKSKNNCVFLGNGPSLNKLRISDLKTFQKKGNKIFAVNHWTENKKFNSIIPDYLIISDSRVFHSRDKIKYKKIYLQNQRLIKFINKNENITLILTPYIIHKMDKKIKNKILTFSDAEFDFLYSSLNPFFPRGYATISLMKGISLAQWLNFKKIFMIGIDNTYFRYLFSDKKNRILYLDVHSYRDNLLIDYSNRYNSIFDYMMDHIKIFKAYEILSKQKNIINLDKFSLTSFFEKKNINYLNK